MTYIKVEIKTKCNGKFCSRNCFFFQRGVIGDWCSYFGPIKRVDKKHFISVRNPECIEAQI